MKETNQLKEQNEDMPNMQPYQVGAYSKIGNNDIKRNTNNTLHSNDSDIISMGHNPESSSNTIYFETEQIISNDQFWYKKLGNCFAFISNKNGDPVLIIGPHWMMYFFLSSLVTCGVFIYLFFFWNHVSFLAKAYGFINYFSFMLCYSYTAIINPGYPKNSKGKITGEPKEEHRFCSECKFWIETDKKVNHCLDCNICVEGYDHHCPWTSKCIGRRNKYSFYGFIASIMLLFGFFLIGIITTPA